LSTLPQEVRGLIQDHLQLAALEVRLASRSLMIMVSAAFCIGGLLVLVWLGLMAAVVLSLIAGGYQPALAILAATALTSVLVLLLVGLIRHRSRDLGLPATIRTLMPSAKNTDDQGRHELESE
jgi:hypothetical protein